MYLLEWIKVTSVADVYVCVTYIENKKKISCTNYSISYTLNSFDDAM